MSILGRMADILQGKTHKLLNALEDPTNRWTCRMKK